MSSMTWWREHDTIEHPMMSSCNRQHTFTRISQSHAMLFGSVLHDQNNRTELKDDCWLLDVKAKLQEEPPSIWNQIRNHFPRQNHIAILEPVSQRLWIMGGICNHPRYPFSFAYSGLLKMTPNLLSLKEICLNWMNNFIQRDDARMLPNEFPLQLKNEMEVYRRKIGQAYWCSKEKGCTVCQHSHERRDS